MLNIFYNYILSNSIKEYQSIRKCMHINIKNNKMEKKKDSIF